MQKLSLDWGAEMLIQWEVPHSRVLTGDTQVNVAWEKVLIRTKGSSS